MLTDCLVKFYKIMVELFAWLLLVGFGIAGYFIGNSLFADTLYSVIGILLGIITGFIIESIILAPCIILYKIHSDLNSHNKQEKDSNKEKASTINSKVVLETCLAITTSVLYYIISKNALGALSILSLMVLIRVNKLTIIKSCLLAFALSCLTLIPFFIRGDDFMYILSHLLINLVVMLTVAMVIMIINTYDKHSQEKVI